MIADLRYVVPGRPATWQRTNLVKGHAVTDKAQRAAKRAHAWAATAAMRGAGLTPGPRDGEYEIEVVGYWPDGRVGDADRLVGVAMDALQGIAYRTDRQVKREVGDVRIDRERPRVEVVLRPLRCERCDTRGALTSEDGQRLCHACETVRTGKAVG